MPQSELLEMAVKSPDLVNTKTGGAYLALCVHCLMVTADYGLVEGDGGNVRWGRMDPPPGWDTNPAHDDLEWVFRYRHRDYQNDVVVHLSLEASSGRMLVHAHELTAAQEAWAKKAAKAGGDSPPEQPPLENVAVCGLLLNKYVAAKDATEWADCVIHEDQLYDTVITYMLLPLQHKAEPRRAGGAGLSPVATAALVAVPVLAVAGFVAWRYYRR